DTVLYVNVGVYSGFLIDDQILNVIFEDDVIFDDELTIDKANVTISNLKFIGNGHIKATAQATNLVIRNNHFEGLNQDAITIAESNGLVVESNTFKDFDHAALVVENLKTGKL